MTILIVMPDRIVGCFLAVGAETVFGFSQPFYYSLEEIKELIETLIYILRYLG